MTAVNSSSETTPVARLVYQSAVEELIPLTISMMGQQAQQDIQGSSEAALRTVFG
jgi:hypothetical protein